MATLKEENLTGLIDRKGHRGRQRRKAQRKVGPGDGGSGKGGGKEEQFVMSQFLYM